MISLRCFFIFSFVFLNSLTSFLYSSELRKECMPGRSLSDLRQQRDDQLKLVQGTFAYKKVVYLRHKVDNLRYDYNHADYKDTLEDLKKWQTDIDRSEKKLAATENELKKRNKDFFDLQTCIKEREFDQFPIR